MDSKEVSRSGMIDWLLQRISAIFLTFYLVCLAVFWLANPITEKTFQVWHEFLLTAGLRLLGGIASLSSLIHATIGIWTVGTDYIKSEKIRGTVLTICYLGIVVCSAWVLVILIGNNE